VTSPAALLDSNVVLAALAEAHEHHAPSLALFDQPLRYAVAAHSHAEVFVTLTRGGRPAPFGFTAAEAWAALARLRSLTMLLGLTPAQQFDALRRYAAVGGVGARLYDALIGEVAVVHALPVIITWNTAHMAGLFPALPVLTPSRFLAAPPVLR
jgi:predicted nucleic acid-binding protein